LFLSLWGSGGSARLATSPAPAAGGGGGGGAATSKLTLIDPGVPFDASAPYTIFTAVIGFTLLGTASYGTDHDMVQRMLTCNSAKKGAWTAIMGIVVGIPVVLVFMIVGLLLWVFYQRPDLMGDAAPAYAAGESRTVFLDYILRELPAGLSGLMLAGLFAAGLSSVNSTLNAMSSAFTNNFYKLHVRGRDEAHYLKVGRLGVVGFGIVLGAFACACVYLQQSSTLIDFALSVMNFAYAGLLAVFFTALFTRRGNTGSVIAALLAGAFVVLLMQPWIWPVWASFVARVLPFAAGLPEVKLAFPWQLLIAVSIAFAVCVSGSPRRGNQRPMVENGS
jgi:Na+/proline symporter